VLASCLLSSNGWRKQGGQVALLEIVLALFFEIDRCYKYNGVAAKYANRSFRESDCTSTNG
jgi:hypothetical protein